MKKIVYITVLAAMALSGSVSRASITSVTNWTYSAGLYCYTPVLDSSPKLTLDAWLYNGSGPEQMGGTILTSSAIDPTLTINDQINNSSGVAWSGFVLDVFMSTTFSIALSASPVANPSGWTGDITIAPHFDAGSGQFMSQIVFSGGTPVSPNASDPSNLLNFTYQVSFSGSTSYSFTEQATAVPVPEPGAWGLWTIGSLLLGFRACKRRPAFGSVCDRVC